MASRLRVGLIFGGPSVEHEVSVISARGVLSGFDPRKIECVAIGVTGDGRWLTPEVSEPILLGDAARVEPPTERDEGARLRIDPGGGGLLQVDGAGSSRPLHVDAVFPLIHGQSGEDGRLQGTLEVAGVPYVGAGVLGSAAGMDKEVTKAILEFHGLPVGPWRSFRARAYRRDEKGTQEWLASEIGFPLFVKPANGGSSVGISKVDGLDSLQAAVESALTCDDKVVVEAALDARELECAVLGNEDPQASVPGEILPSREFYDYAAKYEDGTSELLIPAPVGDSTAQMVRRLAVEAFVALNLAGMARVDFFLERETDRVLLNEANTLPGFTPISMFPKLWEASGVTYQDLLERLVELALDRWAAQQKRVTRRQVDGG